MPSPIDICLNSNTTTIPCAPNDAESLAIFRKDNPHITGNNILSGTPYIVRNGAVDSSQPWQSIRPDLSSSFHQLKSLPSQARCNIANLNNFYGSDLLLALSEFHQGEIVPMVETVKQYNQRTVTPFLKTESHGLAGAAATAMESRMSNFAKSANRYQQALEKIRLAYKAKVPRTEIFQLEKNAKLLHSDMNMKFQAELNRHMGINQARGRGTVWSSSQRGINLAKSARTAQPIKLSSTTSFSVIKGFEKVANVAGKGVILLDVGFRVNNVYHDYNADEDWQRTAVMETTAFGASTAAGMFVGNAVVASMLGVAMFATPVGWVFAIGVGLAASYTAAKIGGRIGKNVSTTLYDTSANFY